MLECNSELLGSLLKWDKKLVRGDFSKSAFARRSRAEKRRVVVSASALLSDARSDLDGDASYGSSEEEAEIDEVDECENDSASAETSPVKKVEVVVNWTGLAYN